MLKHASLFSGIGGFDLAATWMGWQNIFSCEKDHFCREILKFHWPETKQYEDIYQFDATQYRGCVDILSGGFPCQPFSNAGRRKGKADDRYLWPETRRIITEVRPKWIVLENVAGLFTILEPESLSQVEIKAIELFCTDSEQEANATIIRLQRRIIGSIITEIGSAGYLLPQLEDGTPVVLCVPACAVNAPHRRDRTWFVAHAKHRSDWPYDHQPGNAESNGTDRQGRQTTATFYKGRTGHDGGEERADPNGYRDGQYAVNRENEVIAGKGGQYAQHDPEQAHRFATHAYGKGLERATSDGTQGSGSDQPSWHDAVPGWDDWPTQSPVCGRDDGLSRELDGITFSKWRTESIKGFGNAIVPQVALELFRSIAAIHKTP
ncbi:DNA cytosine methyltransferase [Mucilaginibacter sp. X5P1]|uniref:DNA cytosine methyltransferase n=1 Tax=Mucilaginibacter sp. X5P1 TaxID=2723088 RepID=UPI00161FF09A|nr:DNA cytosine methyltransferase [Mucilaginibacter sp. X5P1]MBB6141681.1 DNA (cytosine-5)-methyltransferase 1 [Mucilaginibacter sp. X5P1]